MRWPKRVLGIPIHPLLVHFPITFWLAALVLDVAALAIGPEPWWVAARWATVLGLLIGALAVATGLLEYLEPSIVGTNMRLAARHGVRTSLAWCTFATKTLFVTAVPLAATWLIVISIALDFLGCALLLQGVYFGTKQIYDKSRNSELSIKLLLHRFRLLVSNKRQPTQAHLDGTHLACVRVSEEAQERRRETA